MTLTVHGAADLEALRPMIGSELLQRLRSRRHLCAALPDGMLLLKFPAQDDAGGGTARRQICICLDRERMLLFTDDGRCAGLMREQEAFPPAQALCRFLEALTEGDVDALERLEAAVTDLEDALLTARRVSRATGGRIVGFRRSLLRLKRYYEQLAQVTEFLCGDAAGALVGGQRRGFETLDRHIDRLLGYVMHLSEYVTQVREAYQAQLDYEQNQLMKAFTVLTAIFLPLSLIAGWYGMNFSMPEYQWALGYPFVILLSVVVCGVCFLVFRYKKWL